jgi:hypothetical protein
MRPAFILSSFSLLIACSASYAQGLYPSDSGRPIVGSTMGVRPPSQVHLLGDPNSGKKVHLDPTGKPCVDISAFARPQIVNPKMFDHTIVAHNRCSQPINLKVCYYGSQSCIPVDVSAYGQKQAVLGVFPTLRDFRYEYTEKF